MIADTATTQTSQIFLVFFTRPPCPATMAPLAVFAPNLPTNTKLAETNLTLDVVPSQFHPMQSYLVKRNIQKNQARFYSMSVLPNLFGEWTLRREWGRIGASGQVRLELYQSQTEAEDALLAMENRKRRRGYFMEPQQLHML